METPESIKEHIPRLAQFYEGYVAELGTDLAITVLYSVVRYVLDQRFKDDRVPTEKQILIVEHVAAAVTSFANVRRSTIADKSKAVRR